MRLSQRCTQELVRVFNKHAHPERASAMSSYMRNLFPFFGIGSLERRTLQKEVLNETVNGPLSIEEAFNVAEALYRNPERELHYAACEIIVKAMTKKALGSLSDIERAELLQRTERLLSQHQWWDTVDILAPKIAGGLLRNYQGLLNEWTWKWIRCDDFWLQRSAIISQLHYKHEINPEILFRNILFRAESKEFFVRKAAGWALRQYAYVNPKAVVDFVSAHPELSGLTKREALRRVANSE